MKALCRRSVSGKCSSEPAIGPGAEARMAARPMPADCRPLRRGCGHGLGERARDCTVQQGGAGICVKRGEIDLRQMRPGQRYGWPDRTAMSMMIGSASIRRAMKPSASTVGVSSHWASSMMTSCGRYMSCIGEQFQGRQRGEESVGHLAVPHSEGASSALPNCNGNVQAHRAWGATVDAGRRRTGSPRTQHRSRPTP